MPEYRYRVHLTLVGPVLTQSVSAKRVGLDSTMLRDGEERPALPGTLVRGNLRHAWGVFAEIKVLSKKRVKRWIGPSAEESGDPNKKSERYEPSRARLRFDEFWLAEENPERADVRHRIRIDPDTGAVKTGAYQVIETPYTPGEKVTFSGHIVARLANEAERDKLKHWLEKGFGYLPALGALKGVGFGRLLKAEVKIADLRQQDQVKAVSLAVHEEQAVGASLGLRLTLDRPFCFARPQAGDNRFISEDFVPGSAIKAAIAARLEEKHERYKEGEKEGELRCDQGPWPKLCEHLNGLRITHALPVLRGRGLRPVALPYSMVFAPIRKEYRRDDLYDVALKGNPGLIHGRAPLFSPDWKETQSTRARRYCGWEELPERSLIVRNRIDPKTGTVYWDDKAQAGALYSLETVAPEKHHWLANLHLARIPEDDRPALLRELRNLLAPGLPGLGKTKSSARVDVVDEPYPYAQPSHAPDEQGGKTLVLSLQSAALLLPKGFQAQPTNDGEALLKAYRKTFAELSCNSLALRHFFARQCLAGGKYWWNRFRNRETPYYPLLLTEPGSVFVFDVRDEKAANRVLQEWRHKGLPQIGFAPYGYTWRTNPWIAENGYGEVAVNLELHWRRNPPEEAWDDIGDI